jgi:ureidoacrylate peracid hydrolase
MAGTNRVVTVEARPEPIAIELDRSAVLVVDMQNDFGSPGGMFDRAGIDTAPIRRAIAPTMHVLGAARRVGIPIVYLKQEHAADLSDAGGVDSPHRIKHRPLSVGQDMRAPDGTVGRILVTGTWNTAILPELAPQRGDLVIAKHRYSGFYRTELDERLRSLRISSLIFTGCTTSVCVESTLRDAMYRDYRCLLLEDCAGEPIGADSSRSNHEASLLTIQLLFGWVSSSEHFISALTG